MNKIVNKFLLTGEKFMSKLHLRQLGFTFSVSVLFTRHCERIPKFRRTGNLKHNYKNELGKAPFVHGNAYSDSKDLAKRTILDMVFKEKAYEIAINPKYDRYQRGLASMLYNFFDKKTGSGVRASVIKELAPKLCKPEIKKYKRESIQDLKIIFGQQI